MKPEELERIAHLSKLDCSEEELQKLVNHLNMIIDHAASLQDVDTTNVTPCICVLEEKDLLLRPDEVQNDLDSEDFLKQAPDRIGNFVRVKPVIKF
jgi:aspartyl-tRNA(Asn)/glutamyl-tRNA(Gln) amidotransferase subunit C